MARINLLPWREELRRERQRQFMYTLLMTGALGVVLVFGAITVYQQKIEHQQFRNQLLTKEIRSLETKIKRINELERTRERLISRKQVIERLQASRSQTVALLDNLAKSIPVGITLVTIRQQGPTMVLVGSSQSNARVSAYLRELESNELFSDPQLHYVRSSAKPASSTEPYEFSINVKIAQQTSTDDLEGYDEESGEGGAG